MKNLVELSHSFIRKEIDNSIVLLLEYQAEWNDKDIHFKLIKNVLEINIDKEPAKWSTQVDNELLLNSLKHSYTKIILSAGENGIAEGTIEPLCLRDKPNILDTVISTRDKS